MVTRNLVAGFVLAISLAGVAGAQQPPRVVKRAPATVSADEVAKAAKAAASGKVDNEKGFLEAQSIRAAEIQRKAQADVAGKKQLEQAEKVEEARAKHSEWARQEFERAQGIATATIDAADGQVGQKQEKPARPRYLVFVSQSMGNAALKQVFEIGRGNADVLYVFRGFLPKQTPMQFYGVMAKHQGKGEDKIVQIGLDPPSFEEFGITAVPAIVQLDVQEKLVAKVSGLGNFKWLRDKVASGEKGNLGNRGNTYRIAETDLIAEMKAKAAAVDYKKEAAEAKKRYFRELPTIDLPYATEQRVRHVLPILEVKSDIVDQNGMVRHKAGDRIDMKSELVRAPMLVVFNSQDRYHVEFAKAMAKKAQAGRKVIFLTTRVDREKGIPGYAAQEYALGRPVYLLMQDVKNTFGIERVPTVVTPTEDDFIVVEVPLTQGVSGNAGTDAP